MVVQAAGCTAGYLPGTLRDQLLPAETKAAARDDPEQAKNNGIKIAEPAFADESTFPVQFAEYFVRNYRPEQCRGAAAGVELVRCLPLPATAGKADVCISRRHEQVRDRKRHRATDSGLWPSPTALPKDLDERRRAPIPL